MAPEATLLWQWQRTGVLDRELKLTVRGEIVSVFLGAEGLALAAALEDRRYPLDDLLFDAANLFAGDRFSGTNPRGLGRLAGVCEKAYRRLTIDGWLKEGVPIHYGYGASEVVRALVEDHARVRDALAECETAGKGDMDRLLTEWRSLLRQVIAAGPLVGDGVYGGKPEAGMQRQALHAVHLAFAHPITGVALEFEAPLPTDFAALLQAWSLRYNPLERASRP